MGNGPGRCVNSYLIIVIEFLKRRDGMGHGILKEEETVVCGDRLAEEISVKK